MPVVCTQSMLRKAGKRGPGQREGIGRERARLLSLPGKNKLPGEAVPEPGARWDGCASVLPRKEPDTACIQRGDKHHFRGDRFDLPCIPLRGGRSPSVRSGLRRTGGERPNTADNNGEARQMRPGQLIAKTSASFRSGPAVQRTGRPWRFPLLPDLTLAKANWKSKSIKVLGLNNVLANQILARGNGRHRVKKNFPVATAAAGHGVQPAASECAEWGFPETRRAETR